MKKLLVAGVLLGLLAAGAWWYSSSTNSGLAAFTELTRKDPLFYSGIVNTTEFEAGLASLKRAEAALKEVSLKNIQASSAQAELYVPILQDLELFPFAFLDLLPALHTATESFYTEPSYANAEVLLNLYEQAAAAYRTTIDTHVGALNTVREALADKPEELYFFVDAATSPEVVYKDFLTIQRNAVALEREVAERRECLQGTGSCARLARAADTTSFFAALTPLAAEGPWVEFVKNNFSYAEELEAVRGPYKVTSKCWESADNTHAMYLLRYRPETPGFPLMPKLATDNFYTKVDPEAADVINQALRGRGLDYYAQLETTPYECTNLTYYPWLLALDYLTAELESGATRSELEQKPEYQALAANQCGLLGPAFETVAVVLNLLTSSQQASSYFAATPQFLLATRSAYSLSYMPFAHSVWRTNESLSYLLPRTDSLRLSIYARFANLDDLAVRGYSAEQIHTFHINQRELIESLFAN